MNAKTKRTSNHFLIWCEETQNFHHLLLEKSVEPISRSTANMAP